MNTAIEKTVTVNDTAAAVGSGQLEVLATPVLICRVEEAAAGMDLDIGEGNTTVGTQLQIEHIAATPVGMSVKIKVELSSREGRKLKFDFEAFDETEKIAFGKHERYIVNSEKFLAKANSKKGEIKNESNQAKL